VLNCELCGLVFSFKHVAFFISRYVEQETETLPSIITLSCFCHVGRGAFATVECKRRIICCDYIEK